MKLPEFSDVQEAAKRIENLIHKTPVLSSSYFNDLFSSEIYFKCENFQKVGAFKFRGACNALLSLSSEERSKGVATHSSGNHAQALALASKMLDCKATIVMPNNSSKVKLDAVRGYGADVILCEPTLQARESTLNDFIAKSGAVFIHPYDKFEIIAGQGTACKELIEELGSLDIVVAPVGGGGLLSGTSISAKALCKNVRVVAAEPNGADDAYRSLLANEILPSVSPKTIADGLLTSLGQINFEVIKKNVDEIVTLSEENIIKAMKLVWERMKIIIEPSSATVLAAAFEKPEIFAGKRVGMIFSGGNVDLNKLPWLV